MAPFLELSRLTKTYPGPGGKGKFVVVEDFDLEIEKGEFVCVIGHSGCGKSTVLSIVAGLNKATAGTVRLDGKPLDGPGPDRGVVFQSPCLLPWMTALKNVQLGVDQIDPHSIPEIRARTAARYLHMVGLSDAMDRKPPQLSAGMRQRVGLARAFALSPKMLLLDEPFGMLDSLTRMELQEVLLDLWGVDQKTAFMVTHDVDEALFLADRIVMMTNGPAARVGAVMRVPFARPRNRHDVLADPEYYRLREELIAFLEDHAVRPEAEEEPEEASSAAAELTRAEPVRV